MATEQEMRDALEATPEWKEQEALKAASDLSYDEFKATPEWRWNNDARERWHCACINASRTSGIVDTLRQLADWVHAESLLDATPQSVAKEEALHAYRVAHGAMTNTPQWKALWEFLDKQDIEDVSFSMSTTDMKHERTNDENLDSF